MSPQRNAVALCVAWMGGALLSFTAMAVAARELSADMGTFQMLALRSLIGLLMTAALLGRHGLAQLSLRNLKLHAARNLAHFCGQAAWFHAIALIPLATVFAIEFTTPIWTAVFAAFLLRERMTAPRMAAIALGIAGVLVILRPGLGAMHPAALGMLGGAIAFGLTHVLTKKLSARDSTLGILFYMSAMQMVLAIAPALPGWTPLAPAHWPWLLAIGITGISAHYCVVRAFSYADATVVVPLDFLRLPLIGLLGFVLYGESVDRFLAAGALLILAGNAVNLLRENKRAGGQT